MRLSFRRTLSLALATSMLAAAVPASAALITFDDLGTDAFEAIPNSYHGFTWDFWASINAANYGPSGYANGVVPGGNSACACASDFGQTTQSISSVGKFTLGSGYFTSAWNDGATLSVVGLSGATTLFSTTAVLDTSGPSLLTFNWSGIDKVTFAIAGGSSAGMGGSGNYFALDNLTVTSDVPEPASWAMMIAGFGLVGAVMRRRRIAAFA
ncbi:PEPxxWA-CTERM sorting domain-containing protein [Polymorphobacter fuscus]|uniref:PEPxxWA-CTERM sorting domain-containing protein n=1 Tax=Sandarakinorhabdus fusca TaxID=1439888 RepID=A0A7C9KPA3_9SPHN|nr:PEPxxWA-CTERM sorting domain-containing protein [Polymorphobacter fuscus]KAB7644440.1 PEP-CTERM sorting domain-containing protein [Polymorphobacter fuscus]MQT18364.1 PEPxxWA-CTERM sorting domain-containing protein [Polymorphobacter fuscus]NJC08264.1 hypothetical protein [Polymorphobacter fuscus]